MTDQQGYVFTARDGKRYRTTGEFRVARDEDLQVDFASGSNDLNDGRANVYRSVKNKAQPVIIVEPVQPTYRVTVELNESALGTIKHDVGYVESAWANVHEQVIEAIKAGRYEEVQG